MVVMYYEICRIYIATTSSLLPLLTNNLRNIQTPNGELQVCTANHRPTYPYPRTPQTDLPRYDYVKTFEQPVVLLYNTYLVVRLDGRGFHKYTSHAPFRRTYSLMTYTRLSARYGFQKPNDRAALNLMNAAAVAVMRELPDINVAYGISDEFRFHLLD